MWSVIVALLAIYFLYMAGRNAQHTKTAEEARWLHGINSSEWRKYDTAMKVHFGSAWIDMILFVVLVVLAIVLI